MNEIIKTIGELAKEAGPNGAIYAIGCITILGLAAVLKTKSES